MKIATTGAPVGAEVTGIHLATIPDARTLAALADAVHRHGVLVLRGQHLSEEQHLAFSHAMGPSRRPHQEESTHFQVPGMPEILRLSNIFRDGQAIGILEAGQYWHSDRSFDARPDGYAIIQALTVPRDAGGKSLGDTLFVSAIHAYDTLDADTKARIEGLRAVHDYNNPFSTHRFSDTRRTKVRIEEERLAPVVHDVVRRHPFTGRKSLYMNQHYTRTIEGWDEKSSRELIDRLCAHATREEFQYRHRWQEGDILIWDDIGIQHHAVGDYTLEQSRLVQRTTLDYIWPALAGEKATSTVVAP